MGRLKKQHNNNAVYDTQNISPYRAYILFIRKHLVLVFLSLTLFVSSMTVAFSPLVEMANAKSERDMTLDERALSYATLNALRLCVRDEGAQQADNEGFLITYFYISDSNAKAGKWWRTEGNAYWGTTDGAARPGSYINDSTRSSDKGGDGKTLCNDVLSTGLNLWGYSSALDLLCDAGVPRADGGPCREGSDRFGSITDYSDEIYNAVVRKVYGGQTPSLYSNSIGDYPARYLLYKSAFETGCRAAPSSSSASADFTYTGIKVVTDDGKINDVRYVGGVSKNTNRPVYVDRDNLSEIRKSCRDIAADMNRYATAYADYRSDNRDEPTGVEGDTSVLCETNPDDPSCAVANRTSCAIDGIGWIICPVINFLAGIADASFNFISDAFLRTDVTLLNTSGPTYAAWSVMRNLANIGFVIIFLLIIFSQLTSMGVSNYGVKKMLPRLIIAAVLVNVSFIICQLAVDLSNILGYSIDGAIAGIGNSIPITGGPVDQSATGIPVLSELATGILAMTGAAVVLYALLSVYIPVVLAAVIALVMILFLLIARQALIVILIVLAPLAFLAFLLPNTEKLFIQWRKMFTALLLLFPIIALVFGISKLASTILSTSFSTDLGGDDATNSMWGQIIGAAILILPLFVVPVLLKKSLDGIPVLGQLANRWSGKANSRLGSKIKDSYRGSIVGRGSAMRKQARENYRTRRFAERVSQGGVAGKINQALASNMVPILPADQYANKALIRTAEDVANEALMKDVSAASRSLEGQVTQGTARAIAAGGTAKSIDGKKVFKGSDTATRMAAISKIVESNDIAGMNQLWESSQTWEGQEGDKLRSHLARSLQSSSSKPAYFGAGMLENLRTNQHGKATDGTKTAQGLMTAAIAADAYAPDKIVGTDKDELAAVYHANKERALVDSAYATSHGSKLQSAAAAALADPQLERAIGKNRANINHISGATGGLSATEPRKPS